MRGSTNPASRRTFRCFETDGCERPSSRSISPTERSDESSKERMARRFGSPRTVKVDSMVFIYSHRHIPVKAYDPKRMGPLEGPLSSRCALLREIDRGHVLLQVGDRAGARDRERDR